MNILELYIAKLVDGFKASSPKWYAVVVLFLGTLIYLSENGLPDLIGVDLANVVKYISIVLGFLTGSRTTKMLAEQPKEDEDC